MMSTPTDELHDLAQAFDSLRTPEEIARGRAADEAKVDALGNEFLTAYTRFKEEPTKENERAANAARMIYLHLRLWVYGPEDDPTKEEK